MQLADTIKARLAREGGRHYIDGAFRSASSGKEIDIVNPADGAVIARVPAGDAEDIDAAVTAARRAFDKDGWSTCPPVRRRQLLLALADAIERNADEFAILECLDNGMPLAMAQWAGSHGPVEILRYYAGWPDKLAGEVSSLSVPDHHAYTLREPIGVVGAIVPWNGPMLVTMSKLAPAIAAGCTVVIKPAELTPLTALRLAELVGEVGFPQGVINVVTGHGDSAGRALVQHEKVDKISFTGSTAVGRWIVQAAAASLKRVSLELGGKSPVIILPDANLDKAIDAAAAGIFGNSGQVCVAGSRLYVHGKIYDEVLHGISERARALKLGAGMDPATQMGPLISQQQRERVIGYIEAGVAEGGALVAGGKALEGKGYFVEPTVFAEMREDMRVVREEIFGPVLATMRFEDSDLDAIADIANNTTYGLSAYVWSQDVGRVHALAKKIRAGSIRVNGGTPFAPEMPFGGFKQSGWGRENGAEGIAAFLETKSVTIAL